MKNSQKVKKREMSVSVRTLVEQQSKTKLTPMAYNQVMQNLYNNFHFVCKHSGEQATDELFINKYINLNVY